MPSTTKVSVIMPTYNGAKFIAASIRSVLGQTFKDFELIIINDGSADNTREVITRFRDKRIVYIENKENLGVPKARNRGLRQARGEYIAYCDHDDIYYPNHLKQFTLLLDTHPEIGLVYGNYLKRQAGMHTQILPPVNLDPKSLEVTNFTGAPLNVMHRTKCTNKVGGFDKSAIVTNHAYEDWDLWLRISDYFKFYHLNELLSTYILHDTNRCYTTDASKSFPYVIKKRWRKHNTKARRLNYINSFGIKIIKNLLQNRSFSYASMLAREFFGIQKNCQTFACLGLCSFAKGDFKDAAEKLEHALRLIPRLNVNSNPQLKDDLIIIKTYLAKTLLKLGKNDPALRLLHQLSPLSQDDQLLKQLMARCYLNKRQGEKTLRLLRGLNDAYTHVLRGACHFSRKNYARAAGEFKRAIQMTPQSTGVYYNLGIAYIRLGKYKKAKRTFQKVLHREPENEQAKKMLLRTSLKNKHIPLSPKVSIVMVTYNRAAIINKSILSILRQTFPDYELIIINDGSTDNTEVVVKTYDDPRICYIKSRHCGLPANRNYALKIAKGEYIAYCDDDVIYYRDHIKKLVYFLNTHPKIGLAYTDMAAYVLNKKQYVVSFDFNKYRLETHNALGGIVSVMHRKECLNRVGFFDEKLLVKDDWDILLRMSDLFSFGHLPMVTVKNVNYPSLPALSRSKKSSAYIQRIIKKRVRRATKNDVLLEYINNSAVELLKKLLYERNISFASQLTKNFFKRIQNCQTFTCLGLCSLAKGRFKEAIDKFRVALKLMPRTQSPQLKEDSATIKLYLARSYLELNRTAPAIRLLKQLLLLDHKNTEIKQLLARCYLNKGQGEKTLRLLRGLNDAYTHALRGARHFSRKNYARAAGEFKKAIAIHPRVAMYHHNLATVYARINQWHKAAEEYKKTLHREPRHPQTRQSLKKIYARTQKA